MRKVIFLDVDGVLNSVGFLDDWWINTRMAPGYNSEDFNQSQFDPKAVALLEKLVNEVPGVEIVISSSWRVLHTLPEIRNFIKTAGGLKASSVIIDQTPQHQGYSIRGREVKEWVDEHLDEFDRYVIFDDNGDFTRQQKQTGVFIQTDEAVGLTEADIERAKTIFLA